MTWTQSNGNHTATAMGLDFVLEPIEWSIWSLDQAKASAAFLANLKAGGANPWTPGSRVCLSYRPDDLEPPPPLKARAARRKPNGSI